MKMACLCFVVFTIVSATALNAQNAAPPFASTKDFVAACAEMASRIPADKMAAQGKEGWMFGKSELLHLTRDTDLASHDNEAFQAILDFRSQLEKKGIELVLVPVPPKAVVCADKLDKSADKAKMAKDCRYDQKLAGLYAELAKSGVKIIDLTPEFIVRQAEGENMYCRQDTHWSGNGCAAAAGLIAAEIKGRPWYKKEGAAKFSAKKTTTEITGDLWSNLEDSSIPKEKIDVKEVVDGNGKHVPEDSTSPILLLGDSHNLIYHSGDDMQFEGGGLPDLLAFELGRPVSLVAVRGSGATPSRMNLARKLRSTRGYMDNVKAVVWCFSAREFTEANGGWKKIDIFPK